MSALHGKTRTQSHSQSENQQALLDLRKLGDSEISVSSIGLGCVTFGREIDRATSFEVMDHALSLGINLFDTAAVYGEGASESVVGQWMKDRKVRDKVVVATKVHLPLTAQHILRSADESLSRLGVDQIDLFMLHTWDDETPLEESLDALASLVECGKVRVLGCSNFDPEQLVSSLLYQRANEQPKFVAIEPRYSLVCREIETDLLPMCSQCNIGVMAYSPLGAGFLTGKYAKTQRPPGGTRFDIKPGHQRIYFHDRTFRVVSALHATAAKWAVAPETLALSWVMQNRSVTSTLIGARNTGQVDQAFTAARFEMSEEIKSQLDQISVICAEPQNTEVPD